MDDKVQETKVQRLDYFRFGYPVFSYQCEECGARYIDTNDNFQFCPYCGRKITEVIKEFKNE